MLPASIYRLDEYDNDWYRGQVKEGIRLAEGYYLRLFPVWDTTPQNGRGNNGIILSKAKALSTAARLRNDPKLADLCERQLQWVVGRNPFCQSLMCGEGYDYAPQYTAMSGNMVGALPVGIQTCLNRDVPYWPASNCYVYKETWVFPPARWLWIMRDLVGPARAVGKAAVSVSQESAADGHVDVACESGGHGTRAIGDSHEQSERRQSRTDGAIGSWQTANHHLDRQNDFRPRALGGRDCAERRFVGQGGAGRWGEVAFPRVCVSLVFRLNIPDTTPLARLRERGTTFLADNSTEPA